MKTDKLVEVTKPATNTAAVDKFSVKLAELPETAFAASTANNEAMQNLVDYVSNDHAGVLRVTAIGSGGAYVAAGFFAAAVRENNPKILCEVKTPAEVAEYGSYYYEGPQLYVIFSASGRNPDTLAAVYATRELTSNSKTVVVTLNPELADQPEFAGVEFVCLDFVDKKDGFIATHSMLAFAISVLQAAGFDDPEIMAKTEKILEAATRDIMMEDMLFNRDTWLIVAYDPYYKCVAELIETSIWETGLCPVQTVDVRNFSHGRHAGLWSRQQNAYVVFIQSPDDPVFASMKAILAEEIPGFTSYSWLLQKDAFGLYAGLLLGLNLIGGIGKMVGIDPAKPYGGATPKLAARLYKDTTFRDSLKE